MNILKYTILLFILVMPAFPAFGQFGTKTIFLEVEREGKFVRYRFVAPSTLENAFPGWKAASSKPFQATFSRGSLFDSALTKVELLKVSRYVKYESARVGQQSGAGSAYSHPILFPAAIIDGEIYVFSNQDQTGNNNVINQLIEKLGVKVSNEDDARQLAELYLFFNSGRFDNPAKQIISSVNDVPQDDRAKRQEQTAKLAPLIHPLRVTDLTGRYKVEFFTWEYLPRGEVINWQVSVFPSGRLEVSNSIAGTI